MSEIIEKMRDATLVGAMSSDIGKSSTEDVIALNMSFDYSDPSKARDVLQSYVSSFLRIDSDNQEDQASLAVRFLEDQSVKLQGEIRTIEGEITQTEGAQRRGLDWFSVGHVPRYRQLQRADRRA